jgi:basic membrane lipoprotein Med (substrate-binding protein (PBP1-ABC) superfamily)
VLADVAVGPTGRVDADRLEELALRARELWIGAGLALGQHEELVGELQVLVAQNPYRERLVTQLMLALYRSGRHAEALDVYEATRRRLDDDLGLQPSAGLRELSAQVVRQEAGLRAPARVDDVPPLQVAGPARARRLSGLVAAAAAAAAIAALTAAGSARQIEVAADSDVTRVALVLESTGPAARNEDLVNALDDVSARRHLESDVITVAKTRTAGDLERTVRRLVTGRFDLALVAVDDTTARALAPYVPRIPRTRAVFIDASLPELALEGVENADALRYATEDPGLLAGALSGLTPPRSGHTRLPDLVSVVAERPTRATRLAVDAFVRGFRRAVPDGEVRVDYSGEGRDPTACERIANAQIDAGSDVLFVHSRACGRGALAVARSRGVWAISGDGIARPGDEVLASVFKDWDNAVYSVVAAYVDGTLPSGADLVFGLEGYNVGLEMSPRVAPSVQSRVVALCTDIRARAAGATIPTRTGD